MYGQQPSYGYPSQMYRPGYAYGGQPMTTYGPQPMPGYGYGTPPQPMPGYGYGTPPQPMPGSASGYQPPVPMPGAGAAAGGGALPGQPAATLTVDVGDEAFEPKSITVQPGTMVTWVNRGQHPHTVSFPDVNRDSGELPPGGVFQAIFPTAGTYNYHCRLHPNLTGTVVVGPIAGGTGSTTGGTGTTTGTPDNT
jgi:plastocyanin